MKKEEIILNEGVASRILGFAICSFVIFFYLVALLSISPFNSRLPKSISTSITCVGNEGLNYKLKMAQYDRTHDPKDLPSNCRVVQKTASPFLTIGMSSFISLLVFAFFFKYKKIVVDPNLLKIYEGNVYFRKFHSIKLDNLNSVRIYYVQKKLLFLPYKVITLDLVSSEKTVTYTTNIPSSSNKKINLKSIESVKKAFTKVKPSISFVEELTV